MAKKVAFCLVENGSGEILLIQRGYGKQKYKWSLPGGHVDMGESYARAAYRETREETGLRVKIVSLVLEGKSPAKTYFGAIVGGKLRQFPTHECLDAKFVHPSEINHSELAFHRDRITLKVWREMKDKHKEAKKSPLPDACPHCGSHNVYVRHYPHHNIYRCVACNEVF